MIAPRLASHVQVSALVRLANGQGDFAAVLKKGDATSGSLLLVGQIRGEPINLFEKISRLDGTASWQTVFVNRQESQEKITLYWSNRALRDPDLWVIELDVADDERLNRLLDTSA
jgi:hypothetical protein